MSSQELFKQIRQAATDKGYINYISWAIWDPQNINDTSMFFSEETLAKLNPTNVIVGLNASYATNIFGGFHCSHPGGRDKWLMEATQGTSFEGAYMTDLYKKVEVNSGKIVSDMRSNPECQQRQIAGFHAELACLGKPEELKLIAIGRAAYDKLLKCYPNVQYVPHYAGRITKKRFIERFHEAIDAFDKQ